MSDRAARLRLEVRPQSLSSYQLALRVDGQVALELDVSTWHSMNHVRAKLREDLQRLRDLIGEQLAISDWATVTKGMRHLAEVGDVLLLQLLGSRARDRGVLQDQCRRAW